MEVSASHPTSARGTSTTFSRSVVATNKVDDVLRLGTKDSWGNLNTLDDHFARHGADFGAASADDYARQASEFLQRPGTLTKIDPKTGVIRVYDPVTGESHHVV
jgi:pyocin large subunit-like protein